jgi:hypothetical protein
VGAAAQVHQSAWSRQQGRQKVWRYDVDGYDRPAAPDAYIVNDRIERFGVVQLDGDLSYCVAIGEERFR